MRAPRQRDGLVETIEARRQIAGDAIDLAEVRVDGQHARRLGVERRLVVADVGDRAQERPRVEMRRIGLEDALDPFACRVVAGVVEVQPGEEEVRVSEVGVDLEGFFGRSRGHRWILAGNRFCDAEMRRGPVCGGLDDDLK